MPRDMRSWIKQLEEAGELIRIAKPVHPHTQMGALLYQSREKGLLFENLEGFPDWRSLGMAPANLRHAALAFDTSIEKLIPIAAERTLKRRPVELVSTGPVKEVILKGDQVDLTKLPAHVAGSEETPYIASGLMVARDPDSGIRNVAFHRLQIKGPRKTGALIVPRHTREILNKYEARNQPMPVSIFIGHHPLYYMAAASTGAFEMDELELAGGLIGESARVVNCETNDLEVPFDAEIILEGRILPNVREDEGPFSEFHDYYVAGMGKNPVIEIDCITRRDDAIFKAIQNGSEVEGCIFHKVPFGVAVYNHIKNIGGYVNLHNLLVLPGLFGIVVQMTPRFYGEAKQILMGVLSSPILHPKVAIAVDEDVNIFNYWEVLWAINTRCNPQDDIIVIPGTRIHPMDPTGFEPVPPGGPYWHRVGGKVIIDATKPPLCAGEQARQPFQRLKPKGWETVRLEDFLPQ
jgi:2,5-furandicarboxylate decarboxylase 1